MSASILVSASTWANCPLRRLADVRNLSAFVFRTVRSAALTLRMPSFLAAGQNGSAEPLDQDTNLSPGILDGPEEGGALAFDLGEELSSLLLLTPGLTHGWVASLFPPPAVGQL